MLFPIKVVVNLEDPGKKTRAVAHLFEVFATALLFYLFPVEGKGSESAVEHARHDHKQCAIVDKAVKDIKSPSHAGDVVP